MDLLDVVAKRLYTEMLDPSDRREWTDEEPGIRAQFRGYARAAVGALVDCEDVVAAVEVIRRFGAG